MADVKEIIQTIGKFYGGIIRDDKSKIVGVLSNAEEVDIFSNADYIQAEQIVSADTIPADTEIYGYTAGDDDIVYGYGKETANNRLRIVSVASGGSDNPGAFSTLYTQSSGTDLPSIVSDFKFFRTAEASNPAKILYIKGASSTWNLYNYNIGTAAEISYGQLSGLTGSFMRPTIKIIYGEAFVCHGQYIAKVDKDNQFVEKAFTLPKEWEAIDIIPVSDIALILARNKNRLVNETRCFWWDLTAANTFEDSFSLPMGGPQWLYNYKEVIYILCAINGVAKFFLSQAYPGAKPIEMPNFKLTGLAVETTTQPISSPKMLSSKDGIVYFGLHKTDKTGIYALGQLDRDKPNAFILSKRFAATDYVNHKPTALLIQGSNYYAAYYDGTTASNCRCETNNSPARSSQALIETINIDADTPFTNKQLTRAYVSVYPLPASTSLDLYISSDFTNSYTQIKRANDTIFNSANGVLGLFRPKAFNNKKSFKAKVLFTSSGVNSPKLQNIGLRLIIKSLE